MRWPLLAALLTLAGCEAVVEFPAEDDDTPAAPDDDDAAPDDDDSSLPADDDDDSAADDDDSAPQDDDDAAPDDDDSASQDDDDAAPDDDDDTPAYPVCESVLAQSAHCLVFSADSLSAVGVDDGALCPMSPLAEGFYPGTDPRAVALVGDLAISCPYSGGLHEASVSSGAVLSTPLEDCDAITDSDGELLTHSQPGGDNEYTTVSLYPGTSALLYGQPSSTVEFWTGEVDAYAVAAVGGVVHIRRFQGVDRYDQLTGALLDQVEVYDNAPAGFDVLQDGRMLSAHYFDLTVTAPDGSIQAVWPLPYQPVVTGIVCWP